MTQQDWRAWHASYDDPDSRLSARLREVQRQIAGILERAAKGPIRAVSACAGQGRDLIGALAEHPRRGDVSGRLIEFDPANAGAARAAAAAAGLNHLEVVTGDASTTDAFIGAVPAELVLMCGIFGNISDADVAQTIGLLPQLCAPRGEVVWTRHSAEPDLNPQIRAWFAEAGFEETEFNAPEGKLFGVGTHRLVAPAQALEPGHRLFTFGTEERRPPR